MNHSLLPGLRLRTFGAMKFAPCSRAALMTASRCGSSSVTPGIIGAIMIPQATPASVSSRRASKRLIGLAVPGSIFFQTASSSVGMLNAIWASVTSASRDQRSRSRRTEGDLVSMCTGWRKSSITSRILWVISYFISACW